MAAKGLNPSNARMTRGFDQFTVSNVAVGRLATCRPFLDRATNTASELSQFQDKLQLSITRKCMTPLVSTVECLVRIL